MKKPMSAFFLFLAGCAAAHAETAPLRDDFMMAPIVFRRSQIPPAEQQHYQAQILSEPAEPISDEPPLWVSDRVLLDHRDIQSADACHRHHADTRRRAEAVSNHTAISRQ